jgi:hypothetical protein
MTTVKAVETGTGTVSYTQVAPLTAVTRTINFAVVGAATATWRSDVNDDQGKAILGGNTIIKTFYYAPASDTNTTNLNWYQTNLGILNLRRALAVIVRNSLQGLF